MPTKTFGIILVVVGLLMIAYTGFSYYTTEKVVDLGPVQIDKKKEHFVGWQPVVGVFLLIGGVLLINRGNKSTT